MPHLSYVARTEYPTGEDVDRISHEVIRDVLAVTANPNPACASVIACEIHRRLSELIRVEVELAVAGKPDGSNPAPAAHPASLPEWLRQPSVFGSLSEPR